MDSLKQKTIEYFAAKPFGDNKAQKFFNKEYQAIHLVLNESFDYEDLLLALETLEKFISHVAQEAIQDLSNCWRRLEFENILVQKNPIYTESNLKSKILKQIVSLFGRLRYLEQDRVIDALLLIWRNDQSVNSDVEEVFKNLAEYNLHAFEQIGFRPQTILINRLLQFSNKELENYFPLVIKSCSEFLSTEIEGHSWGYQNVSIKSRSIPASEDIRHIRSSSLLLLQKLYSLNSTRAQKKELLIEMNRACKIWSRSPISDEARHMVNQNTIDVLNYWASLASTEDLELIQVIENHAYWNYHHASSDEIRIVALNVERVIGCNQEYSIYRDLVGFEGIHGSWEEEARSDKRYEQNRLQREERVKFHASCVNENTIEEWLTRVESYLETDSQDLATFPFLFSFINSIANDFPIQVLNRFCESKKLIEAAAPLFRGVWSSSYNTEFKTLIQNWIDTNKFLRELSISIGGFVAFPEDLFSELVNKALSEKDLDSLGLCFRVLEVKKSEVSDKLINDTVKKIFPLMIEQRVVNWVNFVWFSSKEDTLMDRLNNESLNLLIENLVFAPQIDYRVEAILEQIASRDIELVFSFIEKRVIHQDVTISHNDERYDAVPFSLYSIDKVLANYPEQVLTLIKRNYEFTHGVDPYGIASIFKKCIYPFPPGLTDLVLEIIDPIDEPNINLLLAIVTCYEGHSSILVLVKHFLSDAELSSGQIEQMNNSLLNTGIVTGEYGISEAYNQKIRDIESWLIDENINIVNFAIQYIDLLKKLVDNEIKRTSERISLEKHRYGLEE